MVPGPLDTPDIGTGPPDTLDIGTGPPELLDIVGGPPIRELWDEAIELELGLIPPAMDPGTPSPLVIEVGPPDIDPGPPDIIPEPPDIDPGPDPIPLVGIDPETGPIPG
jgi:hypothetical protein